MKAVLCAVALGLSLFAAGCGSKSPKAAAPAPGGPAPELVVAGQKASIWIKLLCDADAAKAKDASDKLVGAGPAAIPELVNGFRYVPPYSGWERVARVLVLLGDPVIPPCCEGLKSPDGPVRYGCARALESFGPKAAAAVPAARAMLKDSLALYRMSGERLLMSIGKSSAPAVPDLVPLLKDPELNARTGAAEALGAIGPEAKAAVPALKEAMKDSMTKEAAADAIRMIDPEALKTGK